MIANSEKHFDVIVIGGGVIGLCSAWFLTQAGCRVAVLEKDEIGSGSSGENAGLIVPSHFIPLAAPGVLRQGMGWMLNPDSPFYIKPRLNLDLARWLWRFFRSATPGHVARSMPLLLELNLASLSLYETFAKLPEFEFGLTQNGLLLLYKTAVGQHECHELVAQAHAFDLPADMLDADQTREKLPGLHLNIGGSAWLPRDAHLNPRQLMDTLHRLLAEQGTTFFTQCEVQFFGVENGRIQTIYTPNQTFSANEIVLASGAWTPGIAHALNLRVPIQAAKGYSFMAPNLVGKLHIPLLLADAKVAITPLAHGIRFAGTLEMAGINTVINQRRIQAMQHAVPTYISDFNLHEETQPPAHLWAGLRPVTPDGLPLIGRVPTLKNLTLAAGHAMMGISLAPITGKLVTEIISGQPPSVDLTLLSANRFN
jgi:D-amino-acid dehydrogenase